MTNMPPALPPAPPNTEHAPSTLEQRKKELYKLRLRVGELYTVEELREVVADLVDWLMEKA